MIAVDANVIVRFLVRDDEGQAEASAGVSSGRKRPRKSVFSYSLQPSASSLAFLWDATDL